MYHFRKDKVTKEEIGWDFKDETCRIEHPDLVMRLENGKFRFVGRHKEAFKKFIKNFPPPPRFWFASGILEEDKQTIHKIMEEWGEEKKKNPELGKKDLFEFAMTKYGTFCIKMYFLSLLDSEKAHVTGFRFPGDWDGLLEDTYYLLDRRWKYKNMKIGDLKELLRENLTRG